MVTRWDEVFALDENPALIAGEPNSLMTRAMGLSMLRTDGETHQRQRAPAHRGLRAIEFRSRWAGMLDEVADDLLDGIEGDGGAELVSAFAGPYAAATLKRLLGLDDVATADMETWSQALIDGIGNYANDPEVWRGCDSAGAGIDAAIERWWARAEPGTVLHSLVADDPHRFDLRRATQRHVAFSRRPHVCLGAFVARQQIGRSALPRLLARFPGLRLAERFTPRQVGWVFRGLQALDVVW